MVANKKYFTLYTFVYNISNLHVYYSKIFQSLILFQKKKEANLRFYVKFWYMKTFAVELKTVKAVEMKVKKS